MGWFFQALVSDCSNPRLCSILLCIFPNPCHSHHTGSSAHLGVPCIRPNISDCHMRSFAHLGVDRLCPRIPITHPYFLSLPVAVLLHAHLSTAPPPPFSFPRVFQGGPKLQRVVQAMMFFGADNWILLRRMLGTLEGVHQRFT